MRSLCAEPYRLFFPIGIAHGFWGVSLWLLYGLKIIPTYPGPLHIQLMIGGFLGSFVFGFITTAVPRFTQTFPARPHEILILALPLIIAPVMNADGALLMLAASYLAAAIFFFGRWSQAQSRPPDPFILIGFGLSAALFGEILMRLAADPQWITFGRLLFLRAFMLLTVVGVGSQMIPRLLGAMSGGCVRSGSIRTNRFLYIGLAFLGGCFIEAFVHPVLGRWVQTAIVGLIAVKHWGVLRLPFSRSKLAWVLWISCWFLLFGLAGESLFPSYSVHFLHLTFIGGFALMTLMVATRVILAHGGFNLILETQLTSLFWVCGFVAVSSVTRVAAGFIPAAYESHLSYAAVLWLTGLAIWTIRLGTKIIYKQKNVNT